MNIDRLIRAMILAKTADKVNAAGYQKEMDELVALREKMVKSETYNDAEAEVFCISLIDCMDVVNHQLYDVYGRIKKATGECTFEQFKAAAHQPLNSFATADFTDAMLECGYDLINDLWEENEKTGDHNADGSFKRDDLVTCPDCHNDVPKGAYCIDCGCDLSMTEEDVEDALPHDPPKYEPPEYGVYGVDF